MWDYGLWQMICDGFSFLYPLTWPVRWAWCFWFGHDGCYARYTKDGVRVASPVKFGFTVETCSRCGAVRTYDN
jgi:hypothetical protein